MTGLFNGGAPLYRRVLIVESGARSVTDQLLARMYAERACESVDVLTCQAVIPQAFDSLRGRIIRVDTAEVKANRGRVVRALVSEPYDVVAVLSTGEGTLRKWKFVIALLTPARVAVVDELGRLRLVCWREAIRGWKLPRLTRRHLSAIRVAGEAGVFPVLVLFLLLSAGWIHLRRLLRQLGKPG